MEVKSKKPILIVLRRSPYGSSLAKASLDVALAAAAFDQDVDLLFLGDGVLQLLSDQDSDKLGIRNIGRQLAALPMYDINQVYVDAKAAVRFNMDLSTAPVETQVLEPFEMQQLISRYDHLLGF